MTASGRIFEYWSHEACLLGIEDYPLMKRRMVEHRERHWWGRPREAGGLEDEVLEILRERGPLPARAFAGSNTTGEMWGWKPAKRALENLVADGRLTCLAVEDGGPAVYVPAGATIDGAPTAAVLLSPFENLLWDRQLAPRLFGFQHIIEVYKPEATRRFGYYVLPLLVRDRFVGRLDIRRDRPADTLDVRAIHREPGQRDTRAFTAAMNRALARVAAAAGVSPPTALP